MKLFHTDNGAILKEIQKKSYWKRFFQFLLGLLLIAISYNLFLAPNELVPGGVSGIAIILSSVMKMDKSLVILFFNVLLLGLSFATLGKEKTKATILGAVLFPLFVNFTSNISSIIPIDNSQLLLPAVFGGVLFGFGSGLIFKAGFTTGGTDIINQVLSKYLKIGVGKSMLLSDGLIVLCSVFTFGFTHLMYSIIVLYLISFMSDRVILGISDSKAFYIITEKDEEVKAYILKYLGHGVTIFKAKGGFKKESRNVLLCVLPTKDYYRLKSGINEIDKDAFFVVTDAYEVFGGE
ncbi:MAG: YitT family protein [Bacilli bacterium]|nr:YitT family protein [Bacilli bacterium]